MPRGLRSPAPPDADGAATALRARLTPPMPRDRIAGWLGPLVVFLVALVMRLHGLTSARGIQFDERYYAKDAFDLLHHGYELDDTGTAAGYVVHPPLGKWVIAMGERFVGHPVQGAPYGFEHLAQAFTRPELGWRLPAAICGSLAVLVLARTARRMFRSTVLGCLAGLLLAFDGLEFTLSRIALLDVFLMFWVVLALACLVLDRDDGRRRLADRVGESGPGAAAWPGPGLGIRWWRLGCGLCLGAATATKWSGVYFLLGLPLLAYAWDAGARRTAGIPSPFLAALRRDWAWLGVGFVVVPVVVYVASWTGWFLSNDAYDRHFAGRHGVWGTTLNWLKYQHQILMTDQGLDAPHPSASKPLSWLLDAKPVFISADYPKPGTSGCPAGTAGGCTRWVLSMGTPTLWWAALVALVVVGYLWLSRRDWRASLVLVGFTVGFAPWLLFPSRTMFIYYMAPVLPFMVLAVTMVAGVVIGPAEASENRRLVGAVAAGALALAVVVTFTTLYPILAFQPISNLHRDSLMWLPSWVPH